MLERTDLLVRVVILSSAVLGGACGSSNSDKPSSSSGGTSNEDSSSSGSGNSAAKDTSSDNGDSSSAGGDNSSGGGDNSSAGGAGSVDDPYEAPPECPKSAISILFSPMYSAYDGEHTFQIPAVVSGLDPTQVDITWSASDPEMVKIEPDPTTGGVMLTTRKAGKVSILANAGNLCGAASLTISDATPQDWADGSARYHDGVVINRLPRQTGGPGGGTGGSSSTANAACTSCHGDNASGAFKTVQHTPMQTGGFSDDELIKIFQEGVVPDDGYFDHSIVSYQLWQTFHKWDVGDTPQSMVVYLRSLIPAAQTGMANFGGLIGGGGRPSGGLGGPTAGRGGGGGTGGT